MKIAICILAVLAIGGIGLGVYGLIQNSQKDTKITSLEADIEDLKNTTTPTITENAVNVEPEKPEETTAKEDASKSENEVTDASAVAYQKFAGNMVKNNRMDIGGHYWHYTGTKNEQKDTIASLQDGHLTIKASEPYTPVIAEADDVIYVDFLTIGNGAVPYYYVIKRDGTVARICMAETSERKFEDVAGYTKIVSIYGGMDLMVHFIDIDGNVYMNPGV